MIRSLLLLYWKQTSEDELNLLNPNIILSQSNSNSNFLLGQALMSRFTHDQFNPIENSHNCWHFFFIIYFYRFICFGFFHRIKPKPTKPLISANRFQTAFFHHLITHNTLIHSNWNLFPSQDQLMYISIEFNTHNVSIKIYVYGSAFSVTRSAYDFVCSN